MKTLTWIFLLIIHLSLFNPSPKLIFIVRGVNIDTSNFNYNALEKSDLQILIEIKNKDKNQFNIEDKYFKCKTGQNRVIKIKPYFDYNTNYNFNTKNKVLIPVKPEGTLFLTIGISCYQFHFLNKNYFYLKKTEKMKYLNQFINNLNISYENRNINFNKEDVKHSFSSVYYPFDPDKPNPMKNIIIIK